jgi:hypothetical protein
VGDKVWVARPKPLGGHKLQAWWAGPYLLKERKGAHSFAVEYAPGELLDVHTDQLKPWNGEDLGEGIPMSYRCYDPPNTLPMGVEHVLAHREGRDGPEFLVRWKGTSPACDSWEPSSRFVRVESLTWQEYCQEHRIPVRLLP